jgi:hypothetical protein
MSNSQWTCVRRLTTVAVTIPISSGPVTIASLITSSLTALGESIDNVAAYSVRGQLAAGGDRGAIKLGDAVGNMQSYYPPGNDTSPLCADTGVFLASAAAAIPGCCIEVYLK